ncbi:hypothetical protein [Magnetococcus marinus]|nr:hypothetical protein [Magnetococcus marinus]
MLRVVLRYTLLLLVMVVALLLYMAQSPFPDGVLRVALDAPMDNYSRPMTSLWQKNRYFAWRSSQGMLFIGQRQQDGQFEATQLGDTLPHQRQPILHVVQSGPHAGIVVVAYHDAQGHLLVQQTRRPADTRAWNPPQLVVDEEVTHINLLENPAGELLLVYQQPLGEQNQIFIRFSHDGGRQWGSATLLAHHSGTQKDQLLVAGTPLASGYQISLFMLQPQAAAQSLHLLQGVIPTGSRSWQPIENKPLTKILATQPNTHYTLQDLRVNGAWLRLLWRDDTLGVGHWLGWHQGEVHLHNLGAVAAAPCGMTLPQNPLEVTLLRKAQVQQISLQDNTMQVVHVAPAQLGKGCHMYGIPDGEDLDLLLSHQAAPNRPSALLGLSWRRLEQP